MPSQPFHIFDQFASRLDVAFFDKKDGAFTDDSVREAMGANDVAALHQVHGGTAVTTRRGIRRDVQADAAATDAPHLALTIRAADCQIFLIYAPEQHLVALAHAGWKGLLAGILPATFGLLREEWGIRPEETYVGAGPSLCRACAQFTDPSRELPGIDPRFFEGRNVDLRAIAEDRLWTLGVRREHFERQPQCTACDSETYWTYRGGDRDAVAKGSTNLLACTLRP
ncbi:MAG: laccase domain-containing protein [Patescibacteria group bacterium]